MGLNLGAVTMRTLICLTLIISSLIMVSEAGLTKNQKKTMKLFKKVRKLANNYNKEMVAMNTSLEEVEKGLEVTTRHLYNTDTFTLVDADFTGTQCGPFDLTSWSENYDIYLAAGSFARFRNTGNANDNTVYVGGTIVAAYGSGITEDWLTTEVCFDTYAATGTTIKVRHESGGSNDCIENTGWKHNKFTVHTVGIGSP